VIHSSCVIVVKRRFLNLVRIFHSRPTLRIKPVPIAKGLWIRFLNIVHTAANDYNKCVSISSNTHEQKLERHVVLVAPEIHWNTGNIGRTCLATGTCLHLIKPLGFSLDSREVQRAGLDYWDKVKLSLWNDFDEFLSKLAPQDGEVAVFSKRGAKSFRTMPSAKRLFLVFGSETRGLAKALLDRYAGSTYYIPITAETRSLNLSTAAGIALYESLRSAEPFHGWPRIK
jgi:tRNA (cytidine/uridine-2'-O-)-methyltransferase